jgi:hypothetical protein
MELKLLIEKCILEINVDGKVIEEIKKEFSNFEIYFEYYCFEQENIFEINCSYNIAIAIINRITNKNEMQKLENGTRGIVN